MSSVAVVIPSYKRPTRLLRAVESVLSTAPSAEVVCVLSSDDVESGAIVPTLEAKSVTVVIVDGQMNTACLWNEGAAATDADYFVVGADDTIFQPGWLEECLRMMDTVHGYGVVGMNEGPGSQFRKLASHFMVSRKYAARRLGGTIMIPVYEHHFTDTEVTDRARRDHALVWAENAMIQHVHPYYGTAEMDEIYEKGYSTYDEGKKLFMERKEAGFPDDFEPVIFEKVEPVVGWGSVAVGLRNMRTWPSEFGRYWSSFLLRGLRNGDMLIDTNVGCGKPHHVAANNLVREFLAGQCDSLLLVDDDMVIPSDSLHLMRDHRAGWDYDVLQAFATHRVYPPHAVALVMADEQPGLPESLNGTLYNTLAHLRDDDVTPVDAVGMAFTLIRRDVLEGMVSEHGVEYTNWFEFSGSEMEDMTFSRKCRERGHRMGVDTIAKIGHIGQHVYGWEEHLQYVNMMEKQSNG